MTHTTFEFTLNELQLTFPFPVSFYTNPPWGKTTIDETQQMASERLLILLAIHLANKEHVKFTQEWLNFIKLDLKNHSFKYVKLYEKENMTKTEKLEMRFSDNASHWLLRYAFCDQENKSWYSEAEKCLFQLRFKQMDYFQWKDFFKWENLNYEICTEFNDNVKEELINLHGLKGDFDKHHFYKVYFTEASKFIKNLKVHVDKGFAYIPFNMFDEIIAERFKEKLIKDLTLGNQWFVPVLKQSNYKDLIQFYKEICKNKINRIYNYNINHDIDIRNLDSYVSEHYPPCMQLIHRNFRKNHHLKFEQRNQYALFLKGIGLSVEQTIYLFKEEFTKKMSEQEFNKKRYIYGIKYNYGLVGGKFNIQPYNCTKLINCNGCPFKNFNFHKLKEEFPEIESFTCNEKMDIEDLMNKNKYNNACERFYEATHNYDPLIFNPNQYFDKSMEEKDY